MPESTFLRAIVSQAWQIAVLTVIVVLLVRLFATNRPQMACWLWLIVIAKCVTPPIWGHSLGLFSQIQSVVPYRDAQTIEAVAIAVEENKTAEFIPDSFAGDVDVYPVPPADVAFNFEPELLANDFETITDSDGAGMQDVWTFITLLLIAGMIVSMLWLSWKFACCLRRIYAHRVTEFDEEIECVVATLVKELRLRRVPRVIISDVRFGPAVLGIFRHLIVLPKCLIADDGCRNPKILRPILAHELMHIRRGDLRTGTLQAVVQCLWWFHPAVWIVNRLLSRETERSCDEQVVAELGCSPMDYARSLLVVIECKHSLKPIPVFPGMKPVEITSQRMERIMSLTQGSRTRMPWWSVVAVVLFAAVVLPGAVVGQQANEPTVEAEVDQDVDVAPSSKIAQGESEMLACTGFGLLDLVTLDLNTMGPREMADILASARVDGFTGTTLVAIVNGKPVIVDDVVGPLRLHVESNPKILAEQKDRVLEAQLKSRIEHYVDQEIVFQAMQAALTEDQKASIEKMLEEPFRQMVTGLKNHRNLTSDEALEESLAEGGNSIELLRKQFFRNQKVLHYLDSLADGSLQGEQKGQARSTAARDLRAKATVVTIFDQKDHAVAVAAQAERPGLEAALATASGRHILGKSVESDSGITGWFEPDSSVFSVRVVGAVNQPGVYEIPEPLGDFRVIDAIALAGGCTELADGGVALRRPLAGGVMSLISLSLKDAGDDEKKSPRLSPGDILIVGMSNEARPSSGKVVQISRQKKPAKPSVPYNAKVVAERAFVRSGSGEPFYATSALGRGSVVRVLREDPNGWLMIEPPQGSFSWVQKQEVRPTTKGKGEILNSDTVVLVGSALKHELDVWQIRMDAGDTVAIFDEQQMSTKTGLTQMLKIQPPTGEYRWIKSSALTPTDEAIRIVEPHPGPQFDVEVYPVDDLVSLLRRPVAANNDEPRDSRDFEKEADLTDRDFASLIELITTTVEPGSWDINGGPGRLLPNVNTRSLVIRQRPYIHDRIVELLGQVRRSKGQPIVTSCELLIFKTPQQIEWLKDNLKFRQRLGTAPWALVPTSGANDILKTAKQHSESISYAPIAAWAGTAASLKLTGREKQFLNLNLKGVPLEGNNLIEMEYGVSLVNIVGEKLPVATCVMGNNQTLLVDISDTRDKSTFRAIAVITPSIVHEAKLEIEQ